MAMPAMNYTELITEALIHAPDFMLTRAEIFAAISARHSHYKMTFPTWQKRIAYKLANHKTFTSVPRMTLSGKPVKGKRINKIVTLEISDRRSRFRR